MEGIHYKIQGIHYKKEFFIIVVLHKIHFYCDTQMAQTSNKRLRPTFLRTRSVVNTTMQDLY